MGNRKMLRQTSTNGCRLPLAPLDCWHRVQQNKKVKAVGRLWGTKDTQWVQDSGLGYRSTLLTAVPQCQSRRTVLCVAEALCHQTPCFSNSFLGTDPKRCYSPPGLSSHDWHPPSVPVQTQDIIWPISNDSCPQKVMAEEDSSSLSFIDGLTVLC